MRRKTDTVELNEPIVGHAKMSKVILNRNVTEWNPTQHRKEAA